MDPQTALSNIASSFDENEFIDCNEHCDALQEWLQNEGFQPNWSASPEGTPLVETEVDGWCNRNDKAIAHSLCRYGWNNTLLTKGVVVISLRHTFRPHFERTLPLSHADPPAITLKVTEVAATKSKRTVWLQPAPSTYRAVSITAEWNDSFGQIHAWLRKETSDPQLLRFLDLWERWHLNDLQAGNVHQQRIIRRHVKYLPRHQWFDESSRLLEHHGQLVSMGYRFGSEWLLEVLPHSVEHELRQLATVLETAP